MHNVSSFWRDEQGQDLVEYSLLMTFIAIAVMAFVESGKTAIQGAVVRKRCAELSMEPQDGSGGCCPRPRNDSADSAMMAAAIDKVACTKSAGIMFGRI